MKVVILAAGKGSRLGEHDLPKPLTKLANGKSILEFQLENISLFLSLHNVILVVGYKKEKLMDAFPNLLYVYNPLYAKENTAKSLLRAVKKVDEDLLWINGDVIFHPSVLESLIAFNQTSMVVNDGAVGEEEVKYCTDKKGKIIEISKNVFDPQGEALGINLFKANDVPILKQNLIECSDRDYFEKAIEFSIGQGVDVRAVHVEQSKCTEIDFPEDLARANDLLKKW